MTSGSCTPADRLLQSLTVHAPGATEAVIRLEMFNVMDEFFRRTNTWRYNTDIDMRTDTTEYGFGTPVDSTVIRVMSVTHHAIPVAPLTQGGSTSSSLGTLVPEQTFPDGDASYAPQVLGPPVGVSSFSYAIYRPEYITLTLPPDEEAVKYPLQVQLALSLAAGCLESDCGDWQVEEWMYDMYFQNWLDGTLARLYGMPTKPWTNEKLASYHSRRWRTAMGQRMQEARRGFVFGVPAWRFPRNGWI